MFFLKNLFSTFYIYCEVLPCLILIKAGHPIHDPQTPRQLSAHTPKKGWPQPGRSLTAGGVEESNPVCPVRTVSSRTPATRCIRLRTCLWRPHGTVIRWIEYCRCETDKKTRPTILAQTPCHPSAGNLTPTAIQAAMDLPT